MPKKRLSFGRKREEGELKLQKGEQVAEGQNKYIVIELKGCKKEKRRQAGVGRVDVREGGVQSIMQCYVHKTV